MSGEFKAAPDIRKNGPAAGGGYVPPAVPKVKERGNQPAQLSTNASHRIQGNQGLARYFAPAVRKSKATG
jgi:hypothetical protein